MAYVPEDGPPVYHYLGVQRAPETQKAVPDVAPPGRGFSWLRRLLFD